jgi:hypothetical protein
MGVDQGICTIVTKNYLSYARTLAHSFLDLHPEHRCYVLVVDEYEGLIDPGGERFELISAKELGIPNYYPQFAFKYNATELSCALKPYLMELLLRGRGLTKLLYFDSDILIVHEATALFRLLGPADIVLTPHLDADFPDDGAMPDDSSIMRQGLFNLGFIGVADSPNGMAFLRWWKDKLRDKCVADPSTGYYVDQKFLDLATCLFGGIHVERSPRFNVAYWNLHSRRVTREGATWLVNGEPLCFFHFSGMDLTSDSSISKWLTRYDLGSRPELAPLFEDYRARLLANGHATVGRWPYGYGRFDTGRPIADSLRAVYRRAARGQDGFDPFCYAQLIENLPNVRPAVADVLVSEAYRLISAGDAREAMRRIDEAYRYDPSPRIRRIRSSYRRWGAKLWLKALLRRRPGPDLAQMATAEPQDVRPVPS